MEMLFSPVNFPYAVALVVLVGLLLIELGIMLVGGSLDAVMPNMHLDVDFPHAVSLLHLGKVPLVILLALFCAGFGGAGLGVHALTGMALPNLIVAPLSVLAGLVTVTAGGRVIRKILPQDETYAVSPEAFIGQVARIVHGDAREGLSAQAKLMDAHGQAHYLQVLPQQSDEILEQGTDVIIVSREEGRYRAVRA